MTRADGLLVNLDPSSARFAEVRRDIAAAEQLYDWLEAAHPEWASTAAGSRIAVLSQRRDLDVERFARRGGPYCNQARNSVLAYERFVRNSNRRQTIDEPTTTRPHCRNVISLMQRELHCANQGATTGRRQSLTIVRGDGRREGTRQDRTEAPLPPRGRAHISSRPSSRRSISFSVFAPQSPPSVVCTVTQEAANNSTCFWLHILDLSASSLSVTQNVGCVV
jgi:hypothetical protein